MVANLSFQRVCSFRVVDTSNERVFDIIELKAELCCKRNKRHLNVFCIHHRPHTSVSIQAKHYWWRYGQSSYCVWNEKCYDEIANINLRNFIQYAQL